MLSVFSLSPALSSYQHLESSLSASLLLFSRLKGKLECTTEVRIRSLKASISLILYSAVQLRSHKQNDPDLLKTAEGRVIETLDSLYQYLKEWVGLHAIFGPSFGRHLLGSAEGELEVHILVIVSTSYFVPTYLVSFCRCGSPFFKQIVLRK